VCFAIDMCISCVCALRLKCEVCGCFFSRLHAKANSSQRDSDEEEDDDDLSANFA
jgi:hypothetical protein